MILAAVLGGLLLVIWWNPFLERGDETSSGPISESPEADPEEAKTLGWKQASFGRKPLDSKPDSTNAEDLYRHATLATLDIEAFRGGSKQPLAGVGIRIVEWGKGWPWTVLGEGETDAEGRLRVPCPSDKRLIVIAEKPPGFVAARNQLDPLEAGSVRQVVMHLHPILSFHLDVWVQDEQGAGLPGVWIRPQEAGRFQPVRSNALGLARVKDIQSEWWIRFVAEKPGYSPRPVQAKWESGEIRLTLKKEAILVGEVIDIEGRKVSEAEVVLFTNPRLFSLAGVRDSMKWHAETDSEGRFRIEALTPGIGHFLIVRAADGMVARVLEPLESGPNFMQFPLRDFAVLSGRTLDGFGQAVAGVGVEALPVIDLQDEHGKKAAYPLSGWNRLKAVSDNSGNYQLGGNGDLFPGRWRIGTDGSLGRARRVGHGKAFEFLEVVHEIEIQAGVQSRPLDLILETGSYVHGYLLDSQERPLAIGTVTASPRNSSHRVRVSTTEIGEDGSFRIGPLRPGFYDISGGNTEIAGSGRVENVPAGSSGIRILCVGGSWIKGRIFDTEGNVRLARACAVSRLGEDAEMYYLRLDGEGKYSLIENQEMTWDLYAWTRDGWAGFRGGVQSKLEQTVEADLRLEPAVAVEFQIPDSQGQGEVIAQLYHRGELVFDGPGDFLDFYRYIPEGQLEVVFSTPKQELGRIEVVIVAGGKYQLQLEN
ncbi:MAG: carboxypeptidase regulatory-like domain-containing protein [Planctomycetota bacterium]|nr:MAG: carboxypeptidase regulatory-like domain-containing protein [Planctomycetota bacterium]